MFWVRFLRSRVFHVILVLVVYSLGVTLRRQELRKAGHGIGKKNKQECGLSRRLVLVLSYMRPLETKSQCRDIPTSRQEGPSFGFPASQ